MSISESSESDTEDFSSSFKNLRGSLRKLDQEIAESIESLQHIRRTVKHTEKHTAPPDMKTEYPLLHKYLTLWKKENRLNHNGSKVLLNKNEARKFNLEEGWTSIYKICKYLKNN